MNILSIPSNSWSIILLYLKFRDINRLIRVSCNVNEILHSDGCQYVLKKKYKERKNNIRNIILDDGKDYDETEMVLKSIYYDFILISPDRSGIVNRITQYYHNSFFLCRCPKWALSFGDFLDKKFNVFFTEFIHLHIITNNSETFYQLKKNKCYLFCLKILSIFKKAFNFCCKPESVRYINDD
jgi:hypothetical protein